MQYEFKTIHDTRSLEDLRKAERLQAAGWQLVECGIWSMSFRREKQPIQPNKRKTSKRKPRK